MELTFSMFCPCSSYAGAILSFFRETLSVEHFCGWYSMDRFSQVVRECRSSCSTCLSFFFTMVLLHMVSSANRRIFDLMPSGRSLMYSRKRLGPRTDPCGTPDSTGRVSDLVPSTTTAVRKSFIQAFVIVKECSVCS